MSQSLRQPPSHEESRTPETPQIWFAEAPDEERMFPRVVFASADDETPIELNEIQRNGPHTVQFKAIGSLMSSLLLHAGLLLAFGMIVTVVHDPLEDIVLTDPILAEQVDEEVIDIEAIGANIEAQVPAAPAKVDLFAHVPETFTLDEINRKFFSQQFAPVVVEEKPPEHQILITPAKGKKFRFRKPGNSQAVTAGSFTVWTEPADPLPKQPYMIVFQVRVPRGLDKFPKSDLKIDVWGTDKFHLRIPDPRHGFALIGDLDVVEGEVQLVIPIPGAPALVRDLIQVESLKILRERQRIVITF